MLRTGLVACLVVLLAAGCGGSAARRSRPPLLPQALAQRWAREAADVALAAQAGNGCRAQQLARSLAEEVAADSGQIPNRLRTPLLSSVAALAGRIACVQVQHPPKPTGSPKPKKPKKQPGPPGPPQGPGNQGDGG